jgi:hypothetical protein
MAEGFNRRRHTEPVSWAEAFPWLSGLVEGEEDGGKTVWPEHSIEDSASQREPRVGTVAGLVMSRLSTRALGEVLPTLPPTTTIVGLSISNRGRNMFDRAGYRTTGDLDELSPLDMLGWRGMGAGTLDDIIRSLVDRAAEAATHGYAREAAQPASRSARPRSEWVLEDDTPEQPQYITDLQTLANWAAMIGATDRALLAVPLPDWAPTPAKEALGRLLGLAADDVDDPSGVRAGIAAKLDDALAGFDERQLSILARRMFADDPVTLDQLGGELGVTRERIRQIESKARGHLLGLIAVEGPLADVAASVRQSIGQVMPLGDLLELFPALEQKVEGVGQPAWRVLDRIDDGYEIEDGWCLAPSRSAARTTTQAQLHELADQYGVVRLDSIVLVETNHPERQDEVTAAWLASCGYIVDDDFVFSRTSSVGDYAAAVLSVAGTPLASQEIIDRFAFERSAGSLRNAMSIDERFERVDRDRWALTEWGMDAYAGIRSKIREQVALAGGRAKLDDLIEFITARYSVSASSVVAYASAPPFECRDGIVEVANADRGVRKTPERTRRLFRRAGAWAYRVRISADHLRGSGSVAPVAIASILNLQYGQTRHLDNPLGPQGVAWTGNQPQFGTIRRFLMDSDIQADTEAFLVIGDDGTFAFESARELTGDPLADALALIGADATADEAAACGLLARAIGLSGTTPVSSIIAAYRERGDGDVADLLTEIRPRLEAGHSPERATHRTEVEDILELL